MTDLGTRATPPHRYGGPGDVVLVVVLIAAALAVVLLIVWIVAGGERSTQGPVGTGGIDRLESDVTAAGLTVCARTDVRDPRATDAVASRTLLVATDCTGRRTFADTGATNDTAVVQVDLFADTAARDAAARSIEGLVRPRASSSVRTYGDLVVVVQGGADDAVADRLDQTLIARGAR